MTAMFENYIEKIVRDKLADLFKKDKLICQCDNCMQDMLTLTLNKLPPMYVSSNIGHIMTMFNLSHDQLTARVTVEILKAVELVKKSPRHGEKK
ncbi:hypothetical protein A2Y85_05710 [candidate division WOR-3 bacterium RBG_13_43_14]|uniref:Competence protein ComFB n=1 Tax=candidate division WOR-3 bacterium RBG_13_43_14 TaxID=1802590 RepID=A0A1F4UEA5_UNCW3|nr:MAG: hypothetical protein A2Y85_05710 [candidate division WOR-3 bacterium RBG_13_43_14]